MSDNSSVEAEQGGICR